VLTPALSQTTTGNAERMRILDIGVYGDSSVVGGNRAIQTEPDLLDLTTLNGPSGGYGGPRRTTRRRPVPGSEPVLQRLAPAGNLADLCAPPANGSKPVLAERILERLASRCLRRTAINRLRVSR